MTAQLSQHAHFWLDLVIIVCIIATQILEDLDGPHKLREIVPHPHLIHYLFLQ